MEDEAKTKRRGSAPSLSKDLIYATALKMADAEGIENISARKIAAELGKTPMALYRHCDSIADIQQGILALAFSEVDASPVAGERWDDTIRRTTSSVRAMYFRHMGAHLFNIESNGLSKGVFGHTAKVQALHHRQGIPDDILERFWRIIDAFLTGFVINEATDFEVAHSGGSLQPKTLPEWANTVEGAYSDQAFHDGIEIIIAGIRSLAAPDPCEWRTPEA